jgi:enterochelin esterase-like enzyme
MTTVATGPLVGRRGVTFLLPDPGRQLRRVWLYQELRRPRLGPPFRRLPAGTAWVLDWRRGGVERMEYLLRLEHADGGATVTPDPGNPLRAAGAFGAKSVVEFPGYRPPCWLDDGGSIAAGPASSTAVPGAVTSADGTATSAAGTVTPMELPCSSLGVALTAQVWAAPPARPDQPLPLLVVHDGPDYASYAGLLRCLGWAVNAGLLPPLRAALLPAPNRDELYAASPEYASALAGEILPALRTALPSPTGSAVVGMGASLGALALLHAQRTAGAPFGGLYLQSGSFFIDRDRRAEGRLQRFERIRAFVGTVLDSAGRPPGAAPAAVLTCGLVEENLSGNRLIAAALRAQGYPVRFAAGRDAHNWVAWRDTFASHLVPFLRELWDGRGVRP